MLTIEKLDNDLAILKQRKEQAVQTFNQIVGAISIIEQLIHRLMNPEQENPQPNDLAQETQQNNQECVNKEG